MSEKNVVQGTGSGDPVLERAKDFWERNNKPILIVCAIIIHNITVCTLQLCC